MNKTTIHNCQRISLPKIEDRRGNLSVIEGDVLPYAIKRVYYLYDVPSGEARGGHAHYDLEQFIVAASGSFDVILDDGINKKRVSLNRPNLALHVVPGLWRELDNFSSGSICMVLASHKYEETDYIRDYDEFKTLKK